MPQGKQKSNERHHGEYTPFLSLVRLLARQAAAEQLTALEAHNATSSTRSTKEEIGHAGPQE